MNTRSIIQIVPPARTRKLAKVPFVELADGRLQGVVSSGSDQSRVYVSFFKAATHDFYCSTNNNRPCGGLRGGPCKHLQNLLNEAVLQYGADRVVRYLKLDIAPEEIKKGTDLLTHLRGAQTKEPAATVFSRFLNHLAFLEYGGSVEPVPEMNWFAAGEDAP